MGARKALHKVVDNLGRDERKTLLFIAERLYAGQTQYGLLDIANDKRDWQFEAAQEYADAAVYETLDLLSKAMKASGQR